MTPEELSRVVTQIGIMKISLGDIIVVKVVEKLSVAARDNMMKVLDGYFPRNMVLILDSGIEIDKITPVDEYSNCLVCGSEEFLTAQVGGGEVFQNKNGTCAVCYRKYNIKGKV